MNPDEYAAAQAVISNQIAQYVAQFAGMFQTQALSTQQWLQALGLLFHQVSASRYQAASLARGFYDSQRAAAYPSLPPHPAFLETYDIQRFAKDMEPARKRMQQANSPQDAVTHVVMQATRVVENAGRQQLIHAVQDDSPIKELQAVAESPKFRDVLTRLGQPYALQGLPQPQESPSAQVLRLVQPQKDGMPSPVTSGSQVVRGWARVATGRETCAWCLMLISRGPVYLDASTAGLDSSNSEVLDAWDHSQGDLDSFILSTDENMEQWHPGCDCKVVPVFKTQSWVGEAAQKRALDLWNDAMGEAISQEDNPGTHASGKNKGKKFTRNELALNALRRKLASGEVTSQEWAAISLAA